MEDDMCSTFDMYSGCINRKQKNFENRSIR
jgi:hypothetical protein